MTSTAVKGEPNMMMNVFLVNAAGISLGVLSIDEKDTIVHYGGGYFARDPQTGTVFRGEIMPIFRQPETILTTYKLNIDLLAERSLPVPPTEGG